MTPIEKLKADVLSAESSGGIRTQLLEAAARFPNTIALGRGDPDLDTPQHIIDAAKKALDNGATHYSAVRGDIKLRTAIAEKLQRENNVTYDPEREIMVTCGAEQAMYLAIFGIINKGDEVIVPSPRYTSYDDALHMLGGVPVPIDAREEDDFNYTAELVDAKITHKTKAISLVNPGNPVGLIGPDVVKAISKLAIEHDLIVLSDEIYENIIFDGTEHLSVAAVKDMHERTITINGPSKSYAMTGWRCGFLAAPAPFCEMLTNPAHTMTICCPAVTQAAALAAYTGPQDNIVEMRNIYDERRKIMMAALDEAGLDYIYPRSGFYVYTKATSSGLTPEEFCIRLLNEQQVLVFPAKLFADPTDQYLRISLLSPTEKVKEAVERIIKFTKSL